MNSREIILANLNHENPPRCGMCFHGGRLCDFVHAGVAPDPGFEQKKWVEGNIEYYDDEWGNLWGRMLDGCMKGEIIKPALEDWSQLDSLRVPDAKNPAIYAQLAERFAEPTDKFKLAGIGGWIFDNARYLRKMEVYFMDMVMFPEELKRLHSRIAAMYEDRIHAAAKYGADGIFIGEDMGTQTGLLFSPDMFREYFKADYTRLMGIAHEYGMKIFMHSCGMNRDILDDLMDCGVDCFQFDQPTVYDMPALAAKFRERKVALWSPVDIQKVLPTGNKEYIESETDRMLETFKGCLLTKNYPDLHGIGVKPEWDNWAYERIVKSFA